MKEQLVSFDTAKLAKEKGFTELCYSYHIDDKDAIELSSLCSSRIADSCCTAPTQSLLQKWLRDEHHIDITIDLLDVTASCKSGYRYDPTVYYNGDIVFECFTELGYLTYEESLEASLEYSLNYLITYRYDTGM